MNIHSILKHIENPSRKTRVIAVVVLSLVLALLVFQAGVAVGYKKASFSRQLGNNFYRAFEGVPVQGDRFAPAKKFPSAGPIPGGHGAAGLVVSVGSSSLIVAGPDNIEKVISIKGDTEVRRFRDLATSSDIRLEDFVVVLGSPDDAGQINARLIRILPSPFQE